MHDETSAPTGPGRRRAPIPMPIRWLAAGGVAALAGVLGLALMLQTGSSAACAAALTGKATFYDIAGGGGNCSYDGPPSDMMHVAMGPGEYADAAACGGYLDVTGPKGKVRVKVVDQCPECAKGHIDLSKEAFAKIGNPVDGIIPVTYTSVKNPALPGPLTFRIKEGASQYWFAVRIDNTGNALRAVQARSAGGGFKSLKKYDYNYWQFDAGLGSGPFTIKLTDVQGNTATVDGIKLAPETTQKSGVRMYGSGAATSGGSTSGGSSKPARSPAASKSPTPSPSAVSPSASASTSASASAEASEEAAALAAAPAAIDAEQTSCG